MLSAMFPSSVPVGNGFAPTDSRAALPAQTSPPPHGILLGSAGARAVGGRTYAEGSAFFALMKSTRASTGIRWERPTWIERICPASSSR